MLRPIGRLLALAALASLTSACFLVFDGDDTQDCPLVAPAIAEAGVRNPDTLLCESKGGSCEDPCGICPATTEPTAIPSWGDCGSRCEGLDEYTCAADPACRVVKDAFCAIGGDCLTDFLGCYPTDKQPSSSIDCYAADASECSRDNACTAMHSSRSCLDPACPTSFALCVPEGTSPGTCGGEVLCDGAPPACAGGTTPGIENGCYTGACIPLELCEPQL